MLKKVLTAALAALFLTAIPAVAHVGHGHTETFATGFFHPIGGLDHILAMVAVGLYAASLGGSALMLVPAAFAGTMIAGGLLGYSGVSIPYVEHVIGLSVAVMGLAIALGVKLRTMVAMALVGAFALFHGIAHGREGAELAAFVPYAGGFVIATALLHAGGVALGFVFDSLGEKPSNALRRSAGSIGALAGVSLLAGWLTV